MDFESIFGFARTICDSLVVTNVVRLRSSPLVAAMAGDDDMDSLFAGMEFVNPLDAGSPLFSQPTVSAPLGLDDFSDQTQPSENSPIQTSDTKPVGLEKAKIGSIRSILAAYDSSSAKVPQPSMVSLPSIHKQSSDSSKPGVRRKRRSVKIGYGRSAADDADEVRSSSGQDETASNGSAIDEQNTGFPELLSAAAQDGISDSVYKASMSSATTGDRDSISSSLNAVDAKHEEPLENLTVFVERLEIADAKSLTSEGHDLHVLTSVRQATATEDSGVDLGDEVVHSREADSRGANVLKNESAEDSLSQLQSTILEGVLVESNIDQDTEDATHQTPSSDRASGLESQEGQNDNFDLQIKIPPGLSIEERVLFIKTAVAKNIDCIHQRIAAVSQARKLAAQKRRQVAEKVSKTSVEFKEVEEEMQAACEREDFEKAEQLDEALVLAQEAKEAAMEEFRTVEVEYDKYASKMHEVIQLMITTEEEGFSLFDRLGQDAAEAANHLTKDHEDEAKKKTEEIVTSEVYLELEKEKLMLEVQKVEDAKLELNSAIDTSVEEESEEKQRLIEERQGLVQELDALLAAVRHKETQIAEHDKKIVDLDEVISSRIAGFEQERMKLETQVSELTSGLHDLERQSESLNEKKSHVEVKGIHVQEAAEKLLELSSIAKAESQKLQDALVVRKTVAKTALSSKEKRLSLATQEKQHVEEAHALRNQASSLRTTLQELASEKMKLQQESLSANQQITSIEKRLPEIEAEKKIAAGSRNFKEAGRLAAEAKGLLSSKERLVAQSRKVMEELQALEQELESCVNDLTQLEGQLQLKEEEAAKARYESLRLLAAATRDERDAASELEDFEEAKSLDLEAETADREADELHKEYGFDAVIC